MSSYKVVNNITPHLHLFYFLAQFPKINFGSAEAQREVPFLEGISRQVGDESAASQLSKCKVSLYLVTFSNYEDVFKDIVTYILIIMQLAKKIRIYPTEEQVNVLWELSGKCRVVYNFALADRKDAYNKEKRSVKYTEQQNKLPDFKIRNPEYNIVYSKTLQGILKKLDSSYHSFFTHIKNGDKKARPSNFKGRNYLMTIPYNQSGFKIEDGIIAFSHKVNNVPLSFEIGNLAEDLNVKQVEIVNDNPYKARGKFFLCIVYDVEIEDTYFDKGIYQAIDLGITKIVAAINTEGKFFEVKTPRLDNY
ncbi:helix-turn-helix domain-containing protein [Methanosarcina sp. WH1]|uniref:RNA-guided endonuclease InsQ/TnpB family protein n=1 Tax=Methanosarcina sp. WH1 TaxID=1434102 RepID=UPI0006157512|nr:helix-turn-helix domain-containing protein [Methanosarcina sp. WH1]AKB21753.1 Transposase [Methanosarcina sp. WH1]